MTFSANLSRVLPPSEQLGKYEQDDEKIFCEHERNAFFCKFIWRDRKSSPLPPFQPGGPVASVPVFVRSAVAELSRMAQLHQRIAVAANVRIRRNRTYGHSEAGRVMTRTAHASERGGPMRRRPKRFPTFCGGCLLLLLLRGFFSVSNAACAACDPVQVVLGQLYAA